MEQGPWKVRQVEPGLMTDIYILLEINEAQGTIDYSPD